MLSEIPEAQEDLLGGQECSGGASSLEELYKPGQGSAARALHCLWHPWQGREGEKLCAKPGFGEELPPAALFEAFP